MNLWSLTLVLAQRVHIGNRIIFNKMLYLQYFEPQNTHFSVSFRVDTQETDFILILTIEGSKKSGFVFGLK